MLFGELAHLDNATVPQERPFEGAAVPRERAPDDGFLFALYLFPELERMAAAVAASGCVRPATPPISPRWLEGTARIFRPNCWHPAWSTRTLSTRALADEIGVGHVAFVDPERLIVTDEIAVAFLRRRAWHIPLKLAEKDGATSYVIVPDRIGLGQLRRLVAQRPTIAGRLKIAAPGALRAALFSRVRQLLANRATSELFDRFPDLSARIVANAWQGSVVGALLVAFPAALWVAPRETWLVLHFFFSFFFLACVGLRFAALLVGRAASLARYASRACRRAAGLFGAGRALSRSRASCRNSSRRWTRSTGRKRKLEIKLVCEADDHDTLAALRALALPRNIEVVEVPVYGPRTKPKALAYALPLAGGEFVALYDAEDHPHPKQLLQAWQKFQRLAAGSRLRPGAARNRQRAAQASSR